MKFGFTGTQEGMTRKQAAELEIRLMGFTGEFHHGDCTGADEEAHDIVKSMGFYIVIHPPIRNVKRAYKAGDLILKPKDYLDRNKDIVHSCEFLIAAPNGEEKIRSGTWSTVRFARAMRKPLMIIYPDGLIERE